MRNDHDDNRNPAKSGDEPTGEARVFTRRRLADKPVAGSDNDVNREKFGTAACAFKSSLIEA
jgi:hypothetical protein